jgi:hypothetical protein
MLMDANVCILREALLPAAMNRARQVISQVMCLGTVVTVERDLSLDR